MIKFVFFKYVIYFLYNLWHKTCSKKCIDEKIAVKYIILNDVARFYSELFYFLLVTFSDHIKLV